MFDVRIISMDNIRACPHMIMVPAHYREDQTCRCDDLAHYEMLDWGYRWDDQTQRWL